MNKKKTKNELVALIKAKLVSSKVNEKLSIEQIKTYCRNRIGKTPFDIAVMLLHELLNCDKNETKLVVESDIMKIQTWCEENGVS